MTETEDRNSHDLAEISTVQFHRFAFKFTVFLFFACKDLDQLHTGNMFGQEGVQLCDFISCDLVSFSGEMPENKSQDCNQR